MSDKEQPPSEPRDKRSPAVRPLRQRAKRRVWFGRLLLLAAAALTLLAERWVHRHGHYPWEDRFGFYASLAVVSSLALVLVSRIAEPLLKRPDDELDDIPSPR